MRRALALLPLALALLSGALIPAAIFPAVAAAGPSSAYARVLHVYQTRGSIPSCQFTSQELGAALGGVDTYGAQYYADFTAAIQTALEARASGACSGSHRHARHLAALPNPGAASLPPSVTASTRADVPAPILLLAVVGGLLAGAAGLAALGRARGWSLAGIRGGGHGGSARSRADWPAGARHGFAEARYRAGGAWAAIIDRLRR